MRVGIELVLLRRQPKTSICIEHFFTERSEELLEYTSSIDTSSKVPFVSSILKGKGNANSSWPNWSMNTISIGCFKSTPPNRSKPSSATRSRLITTLCFENGLRNPFPRVIKSSTMKCLKIETRASNGRAKGRLFKMPIRGAADANDRELN